MCVPRTAACGMGCLLGCCCFGPWSRMYAGPTTESKSKRDICEVLNPQSLLGRLIQSFSRCGAGPPVYKLLLSETVSVTFFGWRRTLTYLHLRTPVRTPSHCLALELVKSSVYIGIGWFCHLSRSVPSIRFCQPIGRCRVGGHTARASSRWHGPHVSTASATHADT